MTRRTPRAPPGPLASTLVRQVFSVYFILAMAVTGIQIGLDYRETLSQVQGELEATARAFEPGVSDAVWNFQKGLAESMAKGVVDGRVVLGVRIRDKTGRMSIDLFQPGMDDSQLSVTRRVDLAHAHRDGSRELIGEMVLYSNQSVVLNRVKFGLLLAFLSSIVKTAGLWLAIVYFSTRLLARPLKALTGQVAAFDVAQASSAPQVRLDDAGAELSYLGEAFNDLGRRVVEHRRQLAELAATLETRVTQRTAELAGQRDFSMALVRSIPEMFFLVTRDGEIALSNPNAQRLVGLDELSADQRNLVAIVAENDRDAVRAMLDKAFHSGESVCEADVLMAGQHPVPHYLVARRVHVDDSERAIVVGLDISMRRKAEEQMRHMALYDNLTELPNRTMLHDRLDQAVAMAMRRDQCMAVLFVDLDGFKAINDSAGHDVGDAVLKIVARRLEASVRSSDTVARFGGDEFVIVLSGIANGQAAARVAEKAIAAVAEPIEVGEQRFHCGASVGISVLPDDATHAALLLELADAAMYRAKRSGKGRYEFASKQALLGQTP